MSAKLLDCILNFLFSCLFFFCTNSLQVSTFLCSFHYPLNNLLCPHRLYLSTSLNNCSASAHIHTCLLTYHLQFTDLNVYVLSGSPNMHLFALSCPCISHLHAPEWTSFRCKYTNVCPTLTFSPAHVPPSLTFRW